MLACTNKLSNFHLTPTAAAVTVPTDWPTVAGPTRGSAGWRLVMFVHPLCPCSRASVAEVAQLAERAGDELSVQIVFTDPATLTAPLTATPLWRAAARSRRVLTTVDAGNVARAFDARSSGETFLYDPNGNLRFHGGVTASRGHVGENAGAAAIAALVANTAAPSAAGAVVTTPVFGCSLE